MHQRSVTSTLKGKTASLSVETLTLRFSVVHPQWLVVMPMLQTAPSPDGTKQMMKIICLKRITNR